MAYGRYQNQLDAAFLASVRPDLRIPDDDDLLLVEDWDGTLEPSDLRRIAMMQPKPRFDDEIPF